MVNDKPVDPDAQKLDPDANKDKRLENKDTRCLEGEKGWVCIILISRYYFKRQWGDDGTRYAPLETSDVSTSRTILGSTDKSAKWKLITEVKDASYETQNEKSNKKQTYFYVNVNGTKVLLGQLVNGEIERISSTTKKAYPYSTEKETLLDYQFIYCGDVEDKCPPGYCRISGTNCCVNCCQLVRYGMSQLLQNQPESNIPDIFKNREKPKIVKRD